MPTILDLPAEVVVRLPLGTTFLLRKARTRDELWKTDRAAIAALALTCRYMYSILNPLLYQTLMLTGGLDTSQCDIIRTINRHPYLGQYVEDVKLRLTQAALTTLWKELQLPSDDAQSATDVITTSGNEMRKNWPMLFGKQLFSHTTNLKQLAVRAIYYNRIPCDFPQLVYAQISCWRDGLDQGLECGGVEQLMLAPKLEKLILSAPRIVDTHGLQHLKSATSNVSILALRLHHATTATLHALIGLPVSLTNIELAITFWSQSSDGPASDQEDTLSCRGLGTVLQTQKLNLNTLSIYYPYDIIGLSYQEVFGGISFNDYPRLTQLSVGPEMFLGWQACIHMDRDTKSRFGPRDPATFADCLPHSLESLTLLIQQYQRPRNSKNYVYKVVYGIMEQKSRLYRLTSISIVRSKDAVYCGDCRIKALTYLDQHDTIEKNELDQIRMLCEQHNIQSDWMAG